MFMTFTIVNSFSAELREFIPKDSLAQSIQNILIGLKIAI